MPRWGGCSGGGDPRGTRPLIARVEVRDQPLRPTAIEALRRLAGALAFNQRRFVGFGSQVHPPLYAEGRGPLGRL